MRANTAMALCEVCNVFRRYMLNVFLSVLKSGGGVWTVGVQGALEAERTTGGGKQINQRSLIAKSWQQLCKRWQRRRAAAATAACV